MEISGVFVNGHVELDHPGALPEGTKVLVRVAESVAIETDSSTLGKRLLKHAGTVQGLPEDLAQQHDHYLHGTPKR